MRRETRRVRRGETGKERGDKTGEGAEGEARPKEKKKKREAARVISSVD